LACGQGKTLTKRGVGWGSVGLVVVWCVVKVLMVWLCI